MKIYTDFTEVNTLLKKKYLGATIQIFLYSLSHKRLAFRIKSNESDKNVAFLVAINCLSITSSFSWKNSALQIHQKEVESICETTFVDEKHGFKLIASGGFAFAEGKELEFGDSFENFLKQDSDI